MRASLGLWLTSVAAIAVAACSSCSSSSSSGGFPGSSSSSGGSGGSSGGSGSGGMDAAMEAGPSAMAACSDFAQAFCNQLQQCTPFALKQAYGDVTTCTQRAILPCPGALAASGTTMTPSDLEQCVQAIKSETCDEALDNPQPSACSIPGTLAAGAACESDWQCSTSFCRLTAGTLCGVCATRAMGMKEPDGGPVCVVDADCAANLVCSGGSCVSPGMVGATCGMGQPPCLRTLTCIGGKCATPLAVGATCAAATDCNGAQGLYCDVKGTKKCVQTGTATSGQPCGVVSGALVACIDASACTNINMQGQGACHPAAGDGQPCGVGVTCMAPAACIKSTAYACQLPDPANCH